MYTYFWNEDSIRFIIKKSYVEEFMAIPLKKEISWNPWQPSRDGNMKYIWPPFVEEYFRRKSPPKHRKNSLPCRHFRPRNVKVNHVVPVPVAPPPRQVITFWCPGGVLIIGWHLEDLKVEFESEPRHKVMVHTHAYDCNEGGAFPPDM